VILKSQSNHLIPGETTTLTLTFSGISRRPDQPNISHPNATIHYAGTSTQRVNGVTTLFYHYNLEAHAEGPIQIPALDFSVLSSKTNKITKIKSSPLNFTVHPATSLTKKVIDVEGIELTYYSLTAADKTTLFPNETTHLEHKIFLTNRIDIRQWKLPLGNKVNCSAWRLSVPNNNRFNTNNTVTIEDKNYQSASFHTHLTAHKTGPASIGPYHGGVVFSAVVMTNHGPSRYQFETDIKPDHKLDLTVVDLPPSPPEHFQGDVGKYQLSTTTKAPPTISASDSIQAIAQLKGTGNLATVNPPKLLDMEGWKIISQDRTDLGDKRKEPQGTAEFTYLLQPDPSQATPTQTPSFVFSVLDPDTAEYITSRIPGLPITVSAATTNITDPSSLSGSSLNHAGLITSPSLLAHTAPWHSKIPSASIHLLTILFFIALAAKYMMRRSQIHKTINVDKTTKRKQLTTLESNSLPDTDFLKSAGSYVERWVDTEEHPESKEILNLRDSLCYRSSPDPAKDSLPASRKTEIINLLKKISLVLLFTLTLAPQLSNAETNQSILQQANDHFESQAFQPAIDSYSSLPNFSESPDVQFNIALCYEKLNQPGHAAYHYLSALQLNPNHPPAKQNLQLLDERNNTTPLSSNQSDIQRWIDKLSPSTYFHLSIFSATTLICLIIIFRYLKPQGNTFSTQPEPITSYQAQ